MYLTRAARVIIVCLPVLCGRPTIRAWAQTTPVASSLVVGTATSPTFVVGDNITYYAVDHTPSYLWNSATWEISSALIPHLRTVLGGPDAWQDEPTIARAIEIQDGEIKNPNILSFQHREATYPHAVEGDAVSS